MSDRNLLTELGIFLDVAGSGASEATRALALAKARLAFDAATEVMAVNGRLLVAREAESVRAATRGAP